MTSTVHGLSTRHQGQSVALLSVRSQLTSESHLGALASSMEAAFAAMAAHTILSFQEPLFSSFPPPQSITLPANTQKAVAVLKGNSTAEGIVTLTQQDNGPTTVNVRVSGLTPGPHGFHLHEFGDLTKGCISTGAHFNPDQLKHGAPKDKIRHAGDLGNIVANADGVAEATIVDNQIPLFGPNSVVGRALVVHELEDDLGKGGQELSLSTGNAGGRLACGVVGLTPV
ncbi:superoxide dismutase [Cu-Zn], chloroplastic-like [Abrus precatorius]|uniref:Superoxide dismutase [Cu-Zn] n=1 Tax=Abrus precatorius TaxID=3816 RepID=A0A8B8K7T3_ABRPR|nr:superoxide dismutase [Cu-Zn], chloroplastic-like [Abrus precatorius]